MKKSIVGLVVAGATLISVIASTPAVAISVIGGTIFRNDDPSKRDASDAHFDIVGCLDIGPCTITILLRKVEDPKTTPWGETYDTLPFLKKEDYTNVVSLTVRDFYFSFPTCGGSCEPLVPGTPVPWETDTLSVIGSTILFAGGLWARNKFARPLQK
jgi:hypothetical protein